VAETPRYIETLPRRGYRFVGTLDPDPTVASGSRSAPDTGVVVQHEPTASATLTPVSTAAEPAVQPGAAPTQAPFRPPQPATLMWIAALAAATLLVGLLTKKFWLPPNSANSHPPMAAVKEPPQASSADRQTVSAASIAVLPFLDMSERKDQEYFSDGLSDELIERLGQTPGLRVIARTSSFYFKGKSEKLETIAQELRVANILEGSVRKDGTRLRVTAQLIRADTSEHLWSQTFDRDLHDVFKVQDEITAAVVSALKIHLISAQRPTAHELGTANLEAYNQFLIGKQSYNQGNSDGYRRATASLRAAISLDPDYAAAYALLALAQFWVADGSFSTKDFESAVAAAQKAVELDPYRGAGYAARGFVRAVYSFDFAGGQSDLEKAVELNPSDADVLHRSAVLLGILGDLPTAISREQQALVLDPLSAEICMRLGFFLAANQQLAQARSLYEKSLAIAENSIRARYNLGQLELLENQPERALATFRQNSSTELRLEGLAKAEYSLGHLEAAQEALNQLIAESATTGPWRIAAVYAWRGEKDQAFSWAERAYEQRDTGLTWIKIDTSFRSLHGDHRYHTLLRKMNLPDS
jgi:TolB-like protein/Tfp pilus assembly protein PilF